MLCKKWDEWFNNMRRIHHYIKQTQPHIRKMNDYNQVHINIYSFFMSSQSPSNSLFTLRFHESLDGLWESCRNAEGAPALSDRKEVTDVACSLQGSGGERRGNRFNQRRHAEITTQPPPRLIYICAISLDLLSLSKRRAGPKLLMRLRH